MNNYKLSKIIIAALSFNIYLLPNIAKADFGNNLPDDYTAPQNHPDKQDTNNTVTKKPESNKKNKETGNQQDNSLLNDDITKHNANAPVYFEGKNADGSRKTGILNLIGNVVIIQDDTKLTSDKAKIIGSPGKALGSGSTGIKKAVATGNVHIVKKSSPSTPEIKASANEIEFIVPQRIMILKGKAKVWKGPEFINAEIIEINLNTGDIKLKEPHGTIDPRSTNSFNKGSSSSGPTKNKVTQ